MWRQVIELNTFRVLHLAKLYLNQSRIQRKYVEMSAIRLPSQT